MSSPKVVDVRFEHYRPENTLGVHETKPRISWRFENAPENFTQEEYELQLSKITRGETAEVCSVKRTSPDSQLVTWPHEESIRSREIYSVRVRAQGKGQSEPTAWSEPATLEAGLFDRKEWSSKLISAPWSDDNNDKPQPADLFRKEFKVEADVQSARLYITAQGIYEAELNGKRVGDYFLAPGWNCYDSQLNYQTYDVTGLLSSGENCLGVHVAEGWYKGRLGFEGGQRNIWGSRTGLQAQLEVQLKDGTTYTVVTDETWTASQGPIKLAEIYDGEKYDATAEIPGWSSPGVASGDWKAVDILPPISESVTLNAGFSEPVRRIETVKPTEIITTPSGKTVLDFGQNLVGYIRIKSIKGPRGHSVTITHAEVMEKEELGIRPLRFAAAQDVYTLKGDEKGESYEPRFTFHGFRYAQVDNWPSTEDNLLDVLEAVVCNTDMEEQGTFACSDDKLNRLFSNVRWGMRGNFVSIPTDCPQRDERLGWTGDLALFAPTATFVYGCVSILRDWLQDVWADQKKQKGIPPMVTPNILSYNKFWGNPWPCAIWHDVTVLAPWALWEETADPTVLADQFESMETWLKCIPRNKTGATHLWDSNSAQLADWLDPTAPPDAPHKAQANPHLVADAFLIRSLDLVARVTEILGRTEDASRYKSEAASARAEFRGEYVTPSGRILSECQTSYCLAICFDLLESHQLARAGERLVDIVRRNGFCVGTGFAGTPFICEALTRTGHSDVAYSMLLNETCPSWLYTISMGATTMWERWDSMLPDGTINPGEMTSFNHYAYGAVAKFMVERLAGLQQLESGWKKTRVQPEIGGEFKWASAQHLTPYGIVSSSWNLKEIEGEKGAFTLQVDVVVPPTTTMEVILPAPEGPKTEVVGSGKWSFTTRYERNYKWPVKAIPSTLPGLTPEE